MILLLYVKHSWTYKIAGSPGEVSLSRRHWSQLQYGKNTVRSSAPESQEGLNQEDNLGVLSESTQEFLGRGDFDIIARTFETLWIVIRDFLKAC